MEVATVLQIQGPGNQRLGLITVQVWKWPLKELVEIDRTVRRIMRSCGRNHFGASVDRFHLPRTRGGRGVLSVIDMHEQGVVRVSKYLKKTRETPT